MKRKLVAMWIEDYLSLKNCTLNFGSANKYEIAYNKEQNTFDITTSSNVNYYDLFLNDDCINNVTGIIGKNGSGKTTIIKLFNILFSPNIKSKPLAVLVYEDIKEKEKPTVFISKLDEEPKIKLNGEYVDSESFSDLASSAIYYSPVLNSQNDKYLYMTEYQNNELNRSASFQFLKFFNTKRWIDISNSINISETYNDFGDQVFDLLFNPLKFWENERWRYKLDLLSFIGNQNDTLKNIPSSVVLKFDFKLFKGLWKGFPLDSDDLNSKYKSNEDCEKIEEAFRRYIQKYNSDFGKIYAFQKKLWLSLTPNELQRLIDFESSDLSFLSENEKSFEKEFSKKLRYKFNESTMSFEFGVNQESAKLLSQLIKDLSLYRLELAYLNSSGEEAILNLYAEIYQAISKNQYEENYIILLDEIETHLHPEWQRRIVSDLISFLRFLKKHKNLNGNFQIVLTSHSPFIISDIPHFSLVKLSKENDTTKIISSDKETFAGSIFDLYKDSFFLDEFISAFAFDKLKDLLQYLNNLGDKNDLLIQNDSDAKAIISLVGDSLLRINLEQILAYREQKRNNDEPFFEV